MEYYNSINTTTSEDLFDLFEESDSEDFDLFEESHSERSGRKENDGRSDARHGGGMNNYDSYVVYGSGPTVRYFNSATRCQSSSTCYNERIPGTTLCKYCTCVGDDGCVNEARGGVFCYDCSHKRCRLCRNILDLRRECSLCAKCSNKFIDYNKVRDSDTDSDSDSDSD